MQCTAHRKRIIGRREKSGSTPLRPLRADARTARLETAPVTSSPLSLASVLRSLDLRAISISDYSFACTLLSPVVRSLSPCASRTVVVPAALRCALSVTVSVVFAIHAALLLLHDLATVRSTRGTAVVTGLQAAA